MSFFIFKMCSTVQSSKFESALLPLNHFYSRQRGIKPPLQGFKLHATSNAYFLKNSTIQNICCGLQQESLIIPVATAGFKICRQAVGLQRGFKIADVAIVGILNHFFFTCQPFALYSCLLPQSRHHRVCRSYIIASMGYNRDSKSPLQATEGFQNK